MDPEEFRRAGHELIDWIADYRSTIEDLPVRASVAPGELRAQLPRVPPTEPESFDAVLADLDSVVLPGVTALQHPNNFAWFPANASLSSVLGDLASSGIGGLGISWESCPALTEVEEVMCDWMRQLVGLSDNWHGTIHDTASVATTVALLAARERATHFASLRQGLTAIDAPLVVYTTDQAHSSVLKAATVAGYGAENVRRVGVDPWTRAMVPDALAEAIAADVENGCRPAVVVATAGTTGTTAFDPIAAIAPIAAEHRLWLHVDAAMAGSAMLLAECRHLWNGIEAADSLCWNPHKWMGTILDISLFYVRDPEHLVRVLSTNPSYLQSSVDGEVTQYRDWGLPLGRRFRALKLWFHLRLDGIEAIQARLRRDLDNAQWLAAQVEETDGWEVVAPVALQTVCVRHGATEHAPDELDPHTLAWVERINGSGRALLTPSRLDDTWMVRVSIGSERTERRNVEALWSEMRRAVR